MSSKGTKSNHAPRRESSEKLRHRFYEPLVLLWVLNPNRRNTISHPSAHPRDESFPHAWRTFLDAVSWFGDYRHGGDSVTAVGGESQQPGVTYWVCSRHEASHQRISEVLQLLESTATTAISEEWQNVESKIIQDSIEFAKDKVKNYRKGLRHEIEKFSKNTDGRVEVNGNENGGSDEDTSPGGVSLPLIEQLSVSTETQDMLDEIERLISEDTEFSELCASAYSFSFQTHLNGLVRKTDEPMRPSPWKSVRHYLFRLGAWHRKARVLVNFARYHAAFLDGHTCRHLPLPGPTSYPTADAQTELKPALKRMLPAGQEARVNDLYSQLISLRTFNLDDAFKEAYTNSKIKLHVHAEVYLLEYFYGKGFEYTLQDKYIGCSKPTCYCCSLYQRYHPANVVLRSSHGNAWATWSPPVMSDDLQTATSGQLNLAVMNTINAHVRRDVIDEIERRLPKHSRVPDSSSGIYSRHSIA